LQTCIIVGHPTCLMLRKGGDASSVFLHKGLGKDHHRNSIALSLNGRKW